MAKTDSCSWSIESDAASLSLRYKQIIGYESKSFLEYYSSFMSLAGMEKMTGINQKQLSNYLNHRAVPRKKQTERIREGIHKFAHELLSITL
jgi:hypothetical protein